MATVTYAINALRVDDEAWLTAAKNRAWNKIAQEVQQRDATDNGRLLPQDL